MKTLIPRISVAQILREDGIYIRKDYDEYSSAIFIVVSNKIYAVSEEGYYYNRGGMLSKDDCEHYKNMGYKFIQICTRNGKEWLDYAEIYDFMNYAPNLI